MAREATVKIPYVPFKTFQTALDTLRQVTPDPLEKSAFGSQSGTTQSWLISAFKALGLIDDAGHPQPILKRLVDPNTRKSGLREVIEDKYRAALDAQTDKQLEDALRGYGVGGDTLTKAKAFLFQATAYLGIPLSPLIRGAKLTSNGENGSSTAVRTPRKRGRRRKDEERAPGVQAPGGSAAATWRLPNGGTATLIVTGDPFSLPKETRDDLFALTDKIREYNAKSADLGSAPGANGAAESEEVSDVGLESNGAR